MFNNKLKYLSYDLMITTNKRQFGPLQRAKLKKIIIQQHTKTVANKKMKKKN